MLDLLRLSDWRAVTCADARNRDREFEALLELHYRRVFALAYRIVGNRDDAADVTQDTFLRVYRALPRLRHDGASSAWVYRIAVNVAVDGCRRKRRSAHVILACDQGHADGEATEPALRDAVVDPAEVAEHNEHLDQIRSAIDNLPAPYRLVVRLHHLEGMRIADIARRLGVPAGTVKSRLSRARAALRRILSLRLALD